MTPKTIPRPAITRRSIPTGIGHRSSSLDHQFWVFRPHGGRPPHPLGGRRIGRVPDVGPAGGWHPESHEPPRPLHDLRGRSRGDRAERDGHGAAHGSLLPRLRRRRAPRRLRMPRLRLPLRLTYLNVTVLRAFCAPRPTVTSTLRWRCLRCWRARKRLPAFERGSLSWTFPPLAMRRLRARRPFPRPVSLPSCET